MVIILGNPTLRFGGITMELVTLVARLFISSS